MTKLTNPLKDQRRWIAPEPLNVSPDLVGVPLATPARRALAILLDVALVGLLSGVNGVWLLGGLALVILQLRSRRGATSGPRLAWGWVGAVLTRCWPCRSCIRSGMNGAVPGPRPLLPRRRMPTKSPRCWRPRQLRRPRPRA